MAESRDNLARSGSLSGLRKLADFLMQCLIAMETAPSLKILDNERENQRLLLKVPEWVVTRWGRKVTEYKELHLSFPPFKVFATFLTREAEIACDPVTSLQALKMSDRGGERTNKAGDTYKRHRNVMSQSLSTSTGITAKPQNCPPRPCSCCQRDHQIDSCPSFLAKPLSDRKLLAKEKGLCYGCLTPGHRTKDCKRRKICSKCSRKHPTSLHDDDYVPNPSSSITFKEESPKEEKSPKSSICNSISSKKCSMALPVWISHQNDPNNERLVYELLDTQSDQTFGLAKTPTSLGVQGPKVTIQISTMSS